MSICGTRTLKNSKMYIDEFGSNKSWIMVASCSTHNSSHWNVWEVEEEEKKKKKKVLLCVNACTLILEHQRKRRGWRVYSASRRFSRDGRFTSIVSPLVILGRVLQLPYRGVSTLWWCPTHLDGNRSSIRLAARSGTPVRRPSQKPLIKGHHCSCV